MTQDCARYQRIHPDRDGCFGGYGGSYIPPELQQQMDLITEAYLHISSTHQFIEELGT